MVSLKMKIGVTSGLFTVTSRRRVFPAAAAAAGEAGVAGEQCGNYWTDCCLKREERRKGK